MKLIVFPLILSFFLWSCQKNSISTGKIGVQPVNLTSCQSDFCNFRYSEWSDIEEMNGQPVYGRFRLFKAELDDRGTGISIWIKAPMEGVAFSLSTQDLREGMVVWNVSCQACRLMPLKVISGSIDGTRIARNDLSAPETWVLDIKIDLSEGETIRKNLYIKQIFYPDFIRPTHKL